MKAVQLLQNVVSLRTQQVSEHQWFFFRFGFSFLGSVSKRMWGIRFILLRGGAWNFAWIVLTRDSFDFPGLGPFCLTWKKSKPYSQCHGYSRCALRGPWTRNRWLCRGSSSTTRTARTPSSRNKSQLPGFCNSRI